MEEKIYKVEIKGVTPLLQNKFTGEIEEPKPTKRKSETNKENKVEDTMYKTPDGQLYQPAESFRQAMIEAGKQFKVGRSNLSKTIASFIQVLPEAIIHKNQKWEVDRRAVVIPSTKGRVMRNRCKLPNWELEFEVKCLDDAELSQTQIHDILAHAGKYLGVGDYRPQKKGMYGTFEVVSFKEAK